MHARLDRRDDGLGVVGRAGQAADVPLRGERGGQQCTGEREDDREDRGGDEQLDEGHAALAVGGPVLRDRAQQPVGQGRRRHDPSIARLVVDNAKAFVGSVE